MVMPPRMTAANIGNSRKKPIVIVRVPNRKPSVTPAMPANSPASTHTDIVTRSVLIPRICASSRLSLVARIALPSFVARSRVWSTPIIANASTMMNARRIEIRTRLDHIAESGTLPPVISSAPAPTNATRPTMVPSRYGPRMARVPSR